LFFDKISATNGSDFMFGWGSTPLAAALPPCDLKHQRTKWRSPRHFGRRTSDKMALIRALQTDQTEKFAYLTAWPAVCWNVKSRVQKTAKDDTRERFGFSHNSESIGRRYSNVDAMANFRRLAERNGPPS
jgi:hypothetical protein